MTKQGCASWIVLGLIGLGLVSLCGDDPSDDPVQVDALSTDPAPVGAVAPVARSGRPTHWRYVQAGSVNCRSRPSTNGAPVGRLQANDHVGVLEERDGWSLVSQPTDCWVRSDYLGAQMAVVEAPRPLYAAAPVAAASRSGGSTHYRNCSHARAEGAAPVYRGDPGYSSRLDRDNDGVGCE